jgi:O-antigen/teichoic acid export membrane protein
MKRHLTNAAYGVLDYVSYPVGMLLVAPIVLRRLGPSEYGLWMISTAVISAGGIIASGFCDANIQRVGTLRGTNKRDLIPLTVNSVLGINLVIGSALAFCAWIGADYAAPRVAGGHQLSTSECLIALRIASALILVRSIETVAVSTQRAFEQYRGTVQISSAVRLVTLAAAAVLALLGYRTVSILMATAVFLLLGTCLQFGQLRRLVGTVCLWPRFHSKETRILLSLGGFAWLQAMGSVVFGQFDRLALGVSFGANAVAPYALCVQFAQPIFGVTASGLSFLFPYLSGRRSTLSSIALKRTLLKAFVCNLFLVAVGAGTLLLTGGWLIQLWAGKAIAQNAARILVPTVIGSALMGLSVTGTYAMQALGRFRAVALINLTSRAAMLLLMIQLLRHGGIHGLALSRVCYGSMALFVYLPLLMQLDLQKKNYTSALPIATSCVQEDATP